MDADGLGHKLLLTPPLATLGEPPEKQTVATVTASHKILSLQALSSSFNAGTPRHGRFTTRFARIDSRESFAIETPIFTVRQADSHESLEFPIRANHPIRANRANRFARITPLRCWHSKERPLEPMKGFKVTSGSPSPRTAASICSL